VRVHHSMRPAARNPQQKTTGHLKPAKFSRTITN
jgi:hypothetical protein